MRSEYGHTSYVKFGGEVDYFAFKNGKKSDMNLFKCTDIKSWNLPLTQMKTSLNKTHEIIFEIDGIQNILIDPAVQYLYIGKRWNMYDRFVSPIEQNINMNMTVPIKANCDKTSVCFFNTTCSVIKEARHDATFAIVLMDDQNHNINYEIPIWRFLIDPRHLGYVDEEYKDTCFLGFFKSNTNYMENIVIGQEFMKEYYTMYDVSTWDRKGKNYIQVGIAPRNKYIDVGQIRYQPNFEDYKKASEY
jgi:hypothetical protein